MKRWYALQNIEFEYSIEKCRTKMCLHVQRKLAMTTTINKISCVELSSFHADTVSISTPFAITMVLGELAAAVVQSTQVHFLFLLSARWACHHHRVMTSHSSYRRRDDVVNAASHANGSKH